MSGCQLLSWRQGHKKRGQGCCSSTSHLLLCLELPCCKSLGDCTCTAAMHVGLHVTPHFLVSPYPLSLIPALTLPIPCISPFHLVTLLPSLFCLSFPIFFPGARGQGKGRTAVTEICAQRNVAVLGCFIGSGRECLTVPLCMWLVSVECSGWHGHSDWSWSSRTRSPVLCPPKHGCTHWQWEKHFGQSPRSKGNPKGWSPSHVGHFFTTTYSASLWK